MSKHSPSTDEANSMESRIRSALKNRLKDDQSIDLIHELNEVLQPLGLDNHSAGGSLTFTGRDPIIKSPLPLASMAAVGLMAKAVAVADLWRFRGGEAQDLSVNLGQVLHRLCPFYDGKWELLNGRPPAMPSDPTNPFSPVYMFPTRDGRFIQLMSIYPRTKTAALAFLGCNDNPRAISEVVRRWDGLELEEAANRAGLQATMIRSVEEFLALEQYQFLKDQPLIEVEKIGDSPPEPFKANPKTPLDGLRALGLGHVIAGSGLGRALAYHGADVLNIWRPNDFEMDLVYYTSNVGMRSSILELASPGDMAAFKQLLSGADVFFSNRRPGYLNKFDLTAEATAELRPGIVHVDMSLFGHRGPWANRIGFDQNAGGVAGMFVLEGSADNPKLTDIFVVNDYVMSWLAAVGVIMALKRRAVEGGSYRVRVSLARLSLWLLQMGIFDKKYAHAIANSNDDHRDIPPELFSAETPCGHYQGVTDQVSMSRTPGHYQTVIVPRGASKAEWL